MLHYRNVNFDELKIPETFESFNKSQELVEVKMLSINSLTGKEEN